MASLFTSRKLDYEEVIQRWPNESDQNFAARLLQPASAISVHFKFSHGPFLLRRLDLRLVNVHLDDEFNVVSVLEWSYVMAIPVDVLANFQSDPNWNYARGLSNISKCRRTAGVCNSYAN